MVEFVLADVLPAITFGLAYWRAWWSVLRKTDSSLCASKAPASQWLTELSLSFQLSITSRAHRPLRLSDCRGVACWGTRVELSALRTAVGFFFTPSSADLDVHSHYWIKGHRLRLAVRDKVVVTYRNAWIALLKASGLNSADRKDNTALLLLWSEPVRFWRRPDDEMRTVAQCGCHTFQRRLMNSADVLRPPLL